MAYEIPQQLAHKEKFMFGLTLAQLGWAFLFGIPALIVLVRGGNMYVNGSISLLLVCIGLLFIFGDVVNWSKWLYSFATRRKIVNTLDYLQKVHGVTKIEQGVVYGKSNVAIIEMQPLNFMIKTTQEKDTLMISFQKFLNSFDFPVQFVVTTQSLELGTYLDNLKLRTKNSDLYNSFSGFITEFVAQNEMRNRKFYLVITESLSLDIQCRVVIDRLNAMGLRSQRLSDTQILQSMNVFFNGVVKQRTQGHDVLTRLFALESIDVDMTHLKVNDEFCRVISAVGYPRTVESGFLDRIISMQGDFDVSIHIEPFNIQTMMVMLNQDLQKQRADLYSEELRGSINPSLEIKYQDTRKILEELQKGSEKLFMVSLYINCKATSVTDLDFLTKKVESELNAGMIQPHVPLFRQLDAYRSMMPLAQNILGIRRNVPTKALSAFFPCTSPFLQTDSQGVMLGLNKNNIPVIKDIFSLSNPNGLVLATSGAGKSYFTKLLILRQIMNGTRVIVVDPQSEYLDMVKAYKGQIVTISTDSETVINPLDLMGHDFLEKRLSLMDLFKIMFGDLTDVQKSILDRALVECYKKKGITLDKFKGRKAPLLKDLYKTLEEMSQNASTMEQITYSALLNRLHIYTAGVFGFLNRESSINFNADFVCFNIGNMPKQVKPVVMFLILDYVYMKMKESKERKLLVIDEAWALLSQTSEASYIFEIVKTCRKFNMGLLLITQDVADLIDSRAGHAVLANSSYSLLLRQKPAIINDVVKAFSLSTAEKEYLLSAVQGSGILISDNDHTELTIVASPEEHKLITTNPNEIVVDIKKDKNNSNELEDYYYTENISDDLFNELLNKKYKVKILTDLGSAKKQEVIIKAKPPEGRVHSFYVSKVCEEISKYTKNYEVRLTGHGDIVFTTKKGVRYCIEVETGNHKDNQKKIRQFNKVKNEFGSKCCIMIIEHSKLYKHYKMLTDIILVPRKNIKAWIKSCFNPQYEYKGDDNGEFDAIIDENSA
jgi:conjugal transfer ATP-binding protein TraC